jgi:putative endonuclease
MTHSTRKEISGLAAHTRNKADRGKTSYLAGLAAEEVVARHYIGRGCIHRDTRWRGKRGEIDLVMADGEVIVFVEVKKSRDFATALSHVTPAQVRRIYATGEEYLATLPSGSLTDVRFDVALVDGSGQFQVVENAFGHA